MPRWPSNDRLLHTRMKKGRLTVAVETEPREGGETSVITALPTGRRSSTSTAGLYSGHEENRTW